MSCLKLLDSVLSGANREKDELMEEKYANYTVNPNLMKTNEINCTYTADNHTVSCNASLYNSSFTCFYNQDNSSIQCNETVLQTPFNCSLLQGTTASCVNASTSINCTASSSPS